METALAITAGIAVSAYVEIIRYRTSGGCCSQVTFVNSIFWTVMALCLVGLYVRAFVNVLEAKLGSKVKVTLNLVVFSCLFCARTS